MNFLSEGSGCNKGNERKQEKGNLLTPFCSQMSLSITLACHWIVSVMSHLRFDFISSLFLVSLYHL